MRSRGRRRAGDGSMRDVASLLSIEELPAEDLVSLLGKARQFEARKVAPPASRTGFASFLSERESVRTRLAVHSAAAMLGMDAVDLDLASAFYADPARRGDHASFVKAELASMRELGCAAVVIRMHDHSVLLAWRELTPIPIINGCSNEEHPLQALSDALVIAKCFGRTEGVRLVLVGNGVSPVFRSLVFLSARLKMNVLLACPEGYGFPPEIARKAGLENASLHMHDLAEALEGADVVYSDSVVYRALTAAEEEAFAPFRLTAAVVADHAPEAYIMHCLPHADEIDAELIHGERSLVMRQVAGRVPVTAAAIDWLTTGGREGI